MEGILPTPQNEIDFLATDKGFLNKLDTLISNHPELSQYRLKLDQMFIERRINSKVKLIELIAKNRKASLTSGYAFGILN